MGEAIEAITTRRLEVVDGEGRVRAVLGQLGQQDGAGFYGLALYDEDGLRASFLVGPLGVDLGMTQDGEAVVSLRVVEGADAPSRGPAFNLG